MKNNLVSDHDAREEVGRILRLLLADEYRLYKITRDYHWNVTGPDYFTLRLLFQLQHEEVTGWVDDVSEWIRTLHLGEPISWTELSESARCSAPSGLGLPAQRMLAELLRSHEEIITQLYADTNICRYYLGDSDMAVRLTELREKHESAAWMVRAQLGATWEKNIPVPLSA